MSLEVEHVEMADMGEYILVVRNMYGIQVGVMWLEVEGGQTSSTARNNCDIVIAFIFLFIIIFQL